MPERWLPEDGEIYLEKRGEPQCQPDRPLSQGDVFTNVPLAMITRHHPDRAVQDLGKANSVTAVLLGHPCSIRGGSTDAQFQQLAQVRSVEEIFRDSGGSFDPPYDGSYFLFPFPRLREDVDYAADFRRLGATATRYLRDRRVACLNHDGWVAFQRRLIWHHGRVAVGQEEQRLATLQTWNELALWEAWKQRYGVFDGFQAWLNADITSAGFGPGSRRDLVAQIPDVIRAEMPDELPTLPESTARRGEA